MRKQSYLESLANVSKHFKLYTRWADLERPSGQTDQCKNLKPNIDSRIAVYRKTLPSRPPAKLFTIPPPKALLAKVDAWLNLSHREKAIVLVIVKIKAIPIQHH